MKLLAIITNKDIKGIEENKDCKIINYDTYDMNPENQLYKFVDKTYYYYFFIIDPITFISKTKKSVIDQIIADLKKYKPAIMIINPKLFILHRSVLHYIFPLITKDIEEDDKYEFLNIIFSPFKEYIIQSNNIQINDDLLFQPSMYNVNRYYRWLYNSFKMAEYKKGTYLDFRLANKEMPDYKIIDQPIEELNFFKYVDIQKYFNTEHPYFKRKKIYFEKREMYGDCSLYHFAHDFCNADRNSIINHLIKIYNYETYLEIGTYNCRHFDDVNIKFRTGVEPGPPKDDEIYQKWEDNIYEMKSNEYFEDLDADVTYDIIFIDGCLLEDNIIADINSALKHLNRNGIIVVHDCNPPHEFLQRNNYNARYLSNKNKEIIWNGKTYTDRHWNGMTWKAIAKLRTERTDLCVRVVDTDWGIGLIQFGHQELFDMVEGEELMQYRTLLKYRKYLLNLISVKEFLEIYKVF